MEIAKLSTLLFLSFLMILFSLLLQSLQSIAYREITLPLSPEFWGEGGSQDVRITFFLLFNDIFSQPTVGPP